MRLPYHPFRVGFLVFTTWQFAKAAHAELRRGRYLPNAALTIRPYKLIRDGEERTGYAIAVAMVPDPDRRAGTYVAPTSARSVGPAGLRAYDAAWAAMERDERTAREQAGLQSRDRTAAYLDEDELGADTDFLFVGRDVEQEAWQLHHDNGAVEAELRAVERAINEFWREDPGRRRVWENAKRYGRSQYRTVGQMNAYVQKKHMKHELESMSNAELLTRLAADEQAARSAAHAEASARAAERQAARAAAVIDKMMTCNEWEGAAERINR